MIIENKIRCKKCGDIIESKTRHDFKWCSCKSVAVDGGKDYLRRLGNFDDFEELSKSSTKEGKKMKMKTKKERFRLILEVIK